MTASALPVLAVTGLSAEARIAAGAGIATVAGGGDAVRLAALLEAHLQQGASGIISFGIAGALAAGLPPGTVILPNVVLTESDRWPVDPDWHRAMAALLPEAVTGNLLGVDAAVADAHAKARLRDRSGAVAVDMESHVAARLASRYGIPFVALRVISDPAERSLPQAALVGMRPDGSTDVGAVLRALVRRPADLPGLIRTALDAQAAFQALKRARAVVGDRLGFTDPRGPAATRAPDADGSQPPVVPGLFGADRT